MAEKIESGTLVKVEGTTVHITTMNREGRFYERDKYVNPGRPIFGTVEGIYNIQKEVLGFVVDEDGKKVMEVVQPAKFEALVEWDGPRHRTSMLPVEILIPRPLTKPSGENQPA